MNANLAAVLYLVAGVLFILSLRGLSSPASSRQGNFLGMIGMAIAVVTTLAAHPPADGIGWLLVVLGIAIGGSIGAVIARRVPMTSMPELVAAFHSLVGMAAVLVAAGAFYAPAAFDIGVPRRDPPRQPGRNVARRRDRRADLHRLGDRLRKTVRPHERRADHSAGAPHHQHRARRVAGLLHRAVGQDRPCRLFLGGHRSSRWCSARS